jgi:putative zinc finger/helix-turn-helix YgiT family protein
MSQIPENGNNEAVVCFDCGSSDVVRTLERQVFQYGSGESAIDLTAEMPVYTCNSCGYQFAGPEADDARHEAVCRYLGVLTPPEIISIRQSTGLSRAEFCELTRVGIASLKRWETGNLIQNAANDELLFLMGFSENVQRLRSRDRHRALNLETLSAEPVVPSSHRSTHRFRGRCLVPNSELEISSKEWLLRVVRAA